MNRNLDGTYFRIERDGKWQNICFTDMTEREIEENIQCKDAEWWKSLSMHLRDVIREIGESFDIARE